MATVIRLSRTGTNKKPTFRVVVADSRMKKEGRIIERIGYFQNTKELPIIKIDSERALVWLRTGATPSETVKLILKKSGVWKQFLEHKTAAKAA